MTQNVYIDQIFTIMMLTSGKKSGTIQRKSRLPPKAGNEEAYEKSKRRQEIQYSIVFMGTDQAGVLLLYRRNEHFVSVPLRNERSIISVYLFIACVFPVFVLYPARNADQKRKLYYKARFAYVAYVYSFYRDIFYRQFERTERSSRVHTYHICDALYADSGRVCGAGYCRLRLFTSH